MTARRLAVAGVLLACWPGALAAQTLRTFTVSRDRGGETALSARVEFAAGTLRLGAGQRGTLYRMDLDFDAERFTPLARFDGSGATATLGVRGLADGGFRMVDQRQLAQRAVIALAPDVPLHLDVTVGAGFGTVDLGGLDLADAAIHTAASRTTVRVSRPTTGHCTSLDLDAGAAELSTETLGNARCANIRFEGGVGQVTLDLTGEWSDALRVEAKMALGELRLRLPSDAGVEIVLDRTLTSFQPTGFTRRGAIYTSANFSQAKRTIHVDVTTAVGGIGVEWVGGK